MSPPRPNIVLIIADDHGYPYSGFMGSDVVQTPNLDRLAGEGVVFTRGLATSSNCRPAMFSLLTGLHPEQWRSDAERVGRPRTRHFPIDRIATLPRLLAGVGYETIQAGKFWEASYEVAGFKRGTKRPYPEGEQKQRYSKMINLSGGIGVEVGRSTMAPLFRLLDERAPDQPFFLWFAPLLPHAPFDAPERYQERYQERRISSASREYYANISWLDESVGELVDYLEARELRRRTLVVYLSDNGYQQDPRQRTRSAPHGKFSLYEPGFRTPVVFSWPGRIPEGVVRRGLVSAVDLFPTLLEFTGVPAPSRHGVSLARSILAGEDSPRRGVIGGLDMIRPDPGGTPWLMNRSEPSRGYFARTHEWRYVWFLDRGREELYRIEEDPGETRNVVAEYPEVARQLRSDVERWRRRMAKPLPDETPRGS